MNFVVDRFGRRKMLIGGAAVMAASMWAIGAIVKTRTSSLAGGINGSGIAAAAMVYVFAVGFCFSYAGVPWIYCSEIFPLNIRGIGEREVLSGLQLCSLIYVLGMASCSATHWLFNFGRSKNLHNVTSGTDTNV
jgi:MFS family permease